MRSAVQGRWVLWNGEWWRLPEFERRSYPLANAVRPDSNPQPTRRRVFVDHKWLASVRIVSWGWGESNVIQPAIPFPGEYVGLIRNTGEIIEAILWEDKLA